jgi:hypothetical protein
MALDQKALQKKRAKREQKRNKLRQQVRAAGTLLQYSRTWAAACKAPIVDVLVPKAIFEIAMGCVWLIRRLPDSRYAMAGYLVDLNLLGVKDAFHRLLEPDEYQQMLAHIAQTSDAPFEVHPPSYARKLVEGAVAYAQQFGFDPHPDYAVAKLLFGDIDASACSFKFTYGQDGKPMYIAGPYDSLATQERIIKRLEQHCGAKQYNFTVPAEGHYSIED